MCRFPGKHGVQIICGSCSDMGQRLGIIHKFFLEKGNGPLPYSSEKIKGDNSFEKKYKKQESDKIRRWIVNFLQEFFIEMVLPIIIMVYCVTVVYLLCYCLI